MEKLNLIKEIPNFENTDFESTSDAFDHESFAQTLFRIVNDNAPPLTIGLFGSWGIGKSSIVNLLKHKLKDKKRFCYVYFNAWKYSSDSFRRQFLITVAESEGIVPESLQKEKLQRLKRLNHSDIIQDRKEKIKFSKGGFLKLGIFILIAAAGVFFITKGGYNKNFAEIGAGVFALTATLIGLITLHLGQIIQIHVDNVVDPKLIFPEQFASEFDMLVRHSLKNEPSKKIIFVIDDIDRCDIDTIKDILVSMKTFLSHSNCYFIVPMDDTSVVQVFKEKNENFGYEQLRKYFGISLKIPTLNQEDIIAFAKKISIEYNIPARITYIAALGNCRDARKMKHFLNSYKLKLALAGERKEKGFLGNINLEQLEMQIAKLTVLEYQYPEIFRWIFNKPDFLNKISQIAREKIEADKALNYLKEFDGNIGSIHSFWEINSGLKDFLQGSYTIIIDDIELLTKFKITSPEFALTELGVKIRDSLIYGGQFDINEESINSSLRENSELVIDVLCKYLTPEIPPVCSRAISLGIGILDLLDEKNKDLLIDNICIVINNPVVNFKLDDTSVKVILDNFKLVSIQYQLEIIEKIEKEFFDSARKPSSFNLILNHKNFSEISTISVKFRGACSAALESWYTSAKNEEEKKKLLTDFNSVVISESERKNIKFDFPSTGLLKNIISDLITKDKFSNNNEIYDLLVADKNQNNLSALKTELNNKIFELIEKNIVDYEYNEFIELGFDFLKNLKGRFIEQETLQKLSPLLNSQIPNFTKEKRALILVDQFLTFELLTDTEVKDTTKVSLDKNIAALTPLDFDSFIELLNSNFEESDEIAISFRAQCLEKVIDVCNANLQQPNPTHLQFAKILRKHSEFVKNKFIEFITGLYSINNEAALNTWIQFIRDTFDDVTVELKNQFNTICFENFNNNSIPSQVRSTYGDLLVDNLEKNKNSNAKNFFSDVINFIDDDDEFNRQYGNKHFDKLLNIYGDETPKAKVNSLLDSIFSKPDIQPFHDSIHNCLKFKSNIDKSIWEKIASRINNDLFKDDLDNQKKTELLNLGFQIEKPIYNSSQLSMVLSEYISNPTNEEVKVKVEELYGNLIARGVISEYRDKKKD